MKNINVAVENVPDTFYLSNAKFCSKDNNQILYISSYSLPIWCVEKHSGRYILIQQDHVNSILAIAELYIFGRKSSIENILGNCQFSTKLCLSNLILLLPFSFFQKGAFR